MDLVLQEEMGNLPVGTILAGWATYGTEPDESATTPNRLLVNVIGFQVPAMGVVFPACMKVTQAMRWGAVLVEDEQGPLLLTAVEVEAVKTFDQEYPSLE